MALILSIETATKVCSVALHRQGKLLGVSELFSEKSHSGAITLLIQNLVTLSGFQLTDIEAIAVSKGPGSYTGLRIGTATAKGLCFALDKPLIAVHTLEAMTYGLIHKIPGNDYLFCPMIDARRMEVYCAVYQKDLQEVWPVDARIINENSFTELLSIHKIIFFGDGAAKCKPLLSHSEHTCFVEDIYPSAADAGELAYQKFTQQIFEDIAYFEPFYLKEFFFKKSG
ncbi:tRNA (adenosine(37)-N6)-threonylcarbamoyltransferase complex dimerization subunit type 1 TsaB [Rhodocytophaga rosea]|uniref:tRNA (Adenosine(37)-N6)-threonylcarbamoyltransferase complex dimerization subunit type 1 TsaB n=1 Tax=Rhodocytophaga rosea TaxID=2704465 RepID=A0A6C0GJY8_9BACT|nr:tRNA (adenosine(37)-N6)-threonylcarbamoyltransferase complex dimerization subunit type 1 TsaB [Rhodocytophaga rosea]QHT68391.1 tRNA (adenosine(37)-N6)-threonylcarbamoyltransferase complex dimerization subunit type 1 TsaB [Rhodocytophaga rosea]